MGRGGFWPPRIAGPDSATPRRDPVPGGCVLLRLRVTACHNLVAVAHAGLSAARLYAGSWSEWCADPGCPVACGPAPGPEDAPGP